jgi:hypothetical protein
MRSSNPVAGMRAGLPAVVPVLLLCAAAVAAQEVELFHESFDAYGSFPADAWGGTPANSGVYVADRGGGDLYVYSPSYRDWGTFYHAVNYEWPTQVVGISDKLTIRAVMRSLGCRSWVGLTRATSPQEETWYFGEYGMNGHMGIKWESTYYESSIPWDSNWHTLEMTFDFRNERVQLFYEGSADPIVTIEEIGTNYQAAANIAFRCQKHGTYSQYADLKVLLLKEARDEGALVVVR